MTADIAILKGIHPGFVLERALKDRKLAKGRFAISINEFPQTLTAITKGKRNMNTPLALRIERALGIEEGFFMTLQVFYEIKEEKRRQHQANTPDLAQIRPVLFWDTDMQQLDWLQQKNAIIKRVFERGNEQEQKEITEFYGQAVIDEVLKAKEK